MDFQDSPQEAAFRAEARAWLEANAEPLPPGGTSRFDGLPEQEGLAAIQGVAAEEVRRRLGLHHLAEGARRPRRDLHGGL